MNLLKTMDGETLMEALARVTDTNDANPPISENVPEPSSTIIGIDQSSVILSPTVGSVEDDVKDSPFQFRAPFSPKRKSIKMEEDPNLMQLSGGGETSTGEASSGVSFADDSGPNAENGLFEFEFEEDEESEEDLGSQIASFKNEAVESKAAPSDVVGGPEVVNDSGSEALESPTKAATEDKKLMALISHFSEDQWNRYESFKRTSFQKPAVKRLMQSISKCAITTNVAIAMAGITKVFIGEVVEEAVVFRDRIGDTGPLQPKHIQEAMRIIHHRGNSSRPRKRYHGSLI